MCRFGHFLCRFDLRRLGCDEKKGARVHILEKSKAPCPPPFNCRVKDEAHPWRKGCAGYAIMADFYEVWRCRGPVLEKLSAMVDAREAAREEELKAATDIKRVYRGKVRTIPYITYFMHYYFALRQCMFQSDLNRVSSNTAQHYAGPPYQAAEYFHFFKCP